MTAAVPEIDAAVVVGVEDCFVWGWAEITWTILLILGIYIITYGATRRGYDPDEGQTDEGAPGVAMMRAVGTMVKAYCVRRGRALSADSANYVGAGIERASSAHRGVRQRRRASDYSSVGRMGRV